MQILQFWELLLKRIFEFGFNLNRDPMAMAPTLLLNLFFLIVIQMKI